MSRSGGAQTDTAEDMVAMQRRAAKGGVNLDFTESPLFPRGPSAETIRMQECKIAKLEES